MSQAVSREPDASHHPRTCRCVVVTTSHSPHPRRLLECLAGRGLAAQVVHDEAGALMALSVTSADDQKSPRVLILEGPPRHVHDTELIAAVKKRFPQTVIWRYVEDGAGLVPAEGPSKPAEPQTPSEPPPEAIESNDVGTAMLSQAELAMLLGDPAAGDRLHDEAPPAPVPPPAISERPNLTACLPAAGEFALLDVLLRKSKSTVDDALAVIRERGNIAGLRYAEHIDAAAAGDISVPIAHEGKTFGYLLAASTTPIELLAPWAGWLARWIDLSRRYAQASTDAVTDDVTGVSNRRYFNRRLGELVDLALRQRFYLTLMLYDIDHFKSYNDRFGHAAGDEILRETAKLMQSMTRPSDVVARIGGDEFAVIFWDAEPPRKPNSRHPDDIVTAANRFKKALSEHRFPKLADHAADGLTISGGLAALPWDARTAGELIAIADRRLIESKNQGRNLFVFGSTP